MAASPTLGDVASALHAGDDARARELLDTLEARGQGGSHDVRFLRGVLHLRAGEGMQAARVFAELEALEGSTPRVASGQALSAWAAGRPMEARARLEEAARTWPENAHVQANLGDVYRALAARAYHRVRTLRAGADAGAEPHPALSALSLHPRAPAPAPSPVAPSPVAPSSAAPSPAAPSPAAPSPVAPSSAAPSPAAPSPAAPSPAAPSPAAPSPAAPSGNGTAPAPPPAASGGCFRAGPWPEAPPSTVTEWLREHGARVLSLSPPLASHHRVYLGPFGDEPEAIRTMTDLKRRGLRDMARIASGPLRNAVSLGVYRKRENADRRVRALRAMDVAPKVQAGGTRLWLHGSAPDLRALTADWSAAFPDAPLAPEPCPPPS